MKKGLFVIIIAFVFCLHSTSVFPACFKSGNVKKIPLNEQLQARITDTQKVIDSCTTLLSDLTQKYPFKGIGVRLLLHSTGCGSSNKGPGNVVVDERLLGSPAYHELRLNDHILSVNSVKTENLPFNLKNPHASGVRRTKIVKRLIDISPDTVKLEVERKVGGEKEKLLITLEKTEIGQEVASKLKLIVTKWQKRVGSFRTELEEMRQIAAEMTDDELNKRISRAYHIQTVADSTVKAAKGLLYQHWVLTSP